MVFPFTREMVPDIDLAAGWLVVNPPAEIDAEDAGIAENPEAEYSGPKIS
jgi:hypothetical protein